jgi:hypothetical protein
MNRCCAVMPVKTFFSLCLCGLHSKPPMISARRQSDVSKANLMISWMVRTEHCRPGAFGNRCTFAWLPPSLHAVICSVAEVKLTFRHVQASTSCSLLCADDGPLAVDCHYNGKKATMLVNEVSISLSQTPTFGRGSLITLDGAVLLLCTDASMFVLPFLNAGTGYEPHILACSLSRDSPIQFLSLTRPHHWHVPTSRSILCSPLARGDSSVRPYVP